MGIPERLEISWRNLGKSALARNTLSMLVGGSARLLLQAVYFILIARSLGAEQYGAFVGAAALIAVLAPFVSLGTGNILVRNVARDRSTFRESWGNALWLTGVCGSILLGLVLLTSRLILSDRVPFRLVALVGLSDLILAGVVGLASQAFQAVQRLHRTAEMFVVLSATRAIAALALVIFVRQPNAELWAVFYFVSSSAAAVYAAGVVCWFLGFPRLALNRLRTEIREGFYFSISLSAQSIYNNIDKTMLVRLATLQAAGIYSIAYRLVDLSFQPVGALLASTYARFFQHGSNGLASSTRYAKRLIPFGAGYGLFAAVFLFVLSPVLPAILGPDYTASVEALRWLAPLVLFKSFHYFLADSLTGADFQGLRSFVQVLIAGLNIGLNFWLLPAYSWRGAAWASLVCDGLLAIGLWAVIRILSRRARETQLARGAQPEVTA